jgi:hypothetical protein
MTDDERLGPPPIEPLSEVAWSRIERGLWAQMDAGDTTGNTERISPSPRWWILATPLVAAAAIAAVVVGTRPSPREVAITDEPARVVSGSAPSAASFGDSHVELDANTAVVMSHESGHPTVLLERGAAWFTVASRKERPEFVVHAGDATVRVVGTRFRVARSDERIAVSVERGVVDVQFRGSVVEVGATQRWSSDTPGNISTLAGATPPSEPIATTEPAAKPATTPAAEPETAPATRPALPEPTRTPPESRSAGKPAPKLDARPEAKLDARPEAKLDARPEPKLDARPEAKLDTRPEAKLDARPEPKLDARPEAKLDTRPEAKLDARPEPKLGGPQAADIDHDRAEYDRLAALEPRDPATALAGYLTLARGTSRWADPALFAAARLAVDRHDQRAETLLGIYLQRFPSGANATDAKQLLARLNRIKDNTP